MLLYGWTQRRINQVLCNKCSYEYRRRLEIRCGVFGRGAAAAFDGKETRRCSAYRKNTPQAQTDGTVRASHVTHRNGNSDSSRDLTQATSTTTANTRCSRGPTTARDDSPGGFCQAVSPSAAVQKSACRAIGSQRAQPESGQHRQPPPDIVDR